MGLLDDVVAAKIKEQVNKADEDKQVATNVQAASSVAKTLAEQTGDATVLNNVHAMLFSETPNGDAKAIPQTKESSKALLDMVTTGANLVERIKQSTAYNQSKEMMNQGLQPVTQSTPVPEGTPTTNVGGIDYAPIEGFQSQKQIDRQDKLEKAYTTSLEKVVSFRSGGLGLQDSKVNQAIDLRTMVDGMKDPETGLYNIPPSAHTELAIGFAKLLSPTGVVNQQTIDEIQQKTAKQGLAGALIYLGGDPKKVGGTTQSVAQFMIHAIDRQGTTAETLRDKYMNGLKGLVPAGLDKKNAERLAKQTLTSSFKDYLNASNSDGSSDTSGFGNRADGTPKGTGFLGVIKRPDGKVSSELSIGVNMGGKETEIPTMVPTLTKSEVDSLINGNKPSKQIIDKAVAFAKDRQSQGKSYFFDPKTEKRQINTKTGETRIVPL